MQIDSVLGAMFERPADEGISLAAVVMIGGEIVAERYGTRPANVFHPETPVDAGTALTSWSMAKSITHALVGLAVVDGLVDVEAPAPVPGWEGTDKERIRLLDLLEMRSGLEFVEDYVDGATSHCLEMLFGAGAADMAAYAASQPLAHEPGTVWNYASGTTNIITSIVGRALGDPGDGSVTGRYLQDRLFDPVGMSSATPHFDEAGTFVGSSYVDATAADFARFGELYRADGVVAGRRILPPAWTDHARTVIAHDPDSGFGYGRHWWTWPEYPGSLAAHGYEGQYTLVVPDRELVLVHLGKTPIEVRPALIARLHDVIRAVE